MAKMLLSSILALSFAATSRGDPQPPPLTYLYTVNLTIPSNVSLQMGTTPLGRRGVWAITGGTFSGPKMNGQLL